MVYLLFSSLHYYMPEILDGVHQITNLFLMDETSFIKLKDKLTAVTQR